MNEADVRFYNRVYEIGKRMKALEERLTKAERMLDLLYGRDFEGLDVRPSQNVTYRRPFEEGHRLKETA